MSDPQGHYELDVPKTPPKPRLPGTVLMRGDRDSVHDVALAELVLHAGNCIRAFGDFHLAIAFEPEIEALVRRLMTDPLYREFPWGRTRVWLAEELGVPVGDPRRRGELLHGLLVEGSGMPPHQAHAIAIDEPDAVARAEATLREHLGWREKGHDRMDFLLTTVRGAGELAGVHDGPLEPASLVTQVVRDGITRIQLTPATARATRCIAVIATGPAAAAGVHAIAARGLAWCSAASSPACEVRWYLDHASAGLAAG